MVAGSWTDMDSAHLQPHQQLTAAMHAAHAHAAHVTQATPPSHSLTTTTLPLPHSSSCLPLCIWVGGWVLFGALFVGGECSGRVGGGGGGGGGRAVGRWVEWERAGGWRGQTEALKTSSLPISLLHLSLPSLSIILACTRYVGSFVYYICLTAFTFLVVIC